MKKLFLLFTLPVLFCSLTFISKNGITEEEKTFAINHLKQTQADLLEAIEDLTEAQLNFKPAPDKWSVLECVQHITLTSQGLWQMTQGALLKANDSAIKSQVEDQQFIQMIENRSMKAQAPEQFRPINSPYKTINETIDAFNADRNKLIDYMASTKDDMRGHIAKLPFATVDTYQLVLMISAHTNRHTQQINEVMDSPGFPEE